MRQRIITAWALGAFVLAQFLPALFFRRDWMLGAVATVYSLVGSGHFFTAPRLDEENIVLSACMLGLGANVVFVGAVVTGFLNMSRVSAILSGFAAANGAIAVLALIGARATFTPLVGCLFWLGAMFWLCAGSCRVVFMSGRRPSSHS